ncbi:uncharacterized protein B0T15DRAFT_576164 [Chaetomium strumarium]|uniref:Peptidase C1A papain C-terminal domain-containing protein n=1 Tax=Chaetomium strumarium TaxID=1170767 RepID=A0AAJ0GRG8_9PEZI|nr:hypothetical protein B0T15DRAFT_576164 [Chaetomium strumarium]
MSCGTWEAGPSSWGGRIPEILPTALKVDPKASPIDQVKQAYDDIYSRIQQTSQFTRNKAIAFIELHKSQRNATLEQQLGSSNAQKIAATAAIHGLVVSANSMIDTLNAMYLMDVSPEDFAAVSRFLQYADAHSLQDAAEAAANLPGLSDANEDPDDAGDLSLLIRKDTGCSSRSAVKCLLDQDADSGLFHDVDTTPNPCAPTDLEKATFQEKLISLANTTPQTTKGILQDSQGPPNMRIAFARIFDEAAKARIENPTKMTDSDWQMIYDQPAVVLLEQNLRDGFPFIFTTQLVLGARFNKHEIGQDAVWVKPPIENVITRGRHTMLAVGFDPGRRLFLVQNSWGPKWPLSYSGSDERLRGRFWMPYEWFEAAVDGKPLTYDFWVPCTIPS